MLNALLQFLFSDTNHTHKNVCPFHRANDNALLIPAAVSPSSFERPYRNIKHSNQRYRQSTPAHVSKKDGTINNWIILVFIMHLSLSI